MEYLYLGRGRLLCSLTPEEATECRENRRQCIEKILGQLGQFFDGEKKRIVMEQFDSPGGGCELFLTQHKHRRETNMIRQSEESAITEYRRYYTREREGIYRFDGIENLLVACKLLKKSGYHGKSEAYADRERGRYYLFLETESSYPAEALGERCELGQKDYIREHCTGLFGEHALGYLGDLA